MQKGDANDDDEDANGGMTPRTAQRTAAAEASSQVVTLVHSPPCYVYGAVFHPMADPPLLLSVLSMVTFVCGMQCRQMIITAVTMIASMANYREVTTKPALTV